MPTSDKSSPGRWNSPELRRVSAWHSVPSVDTLDVLDVMRKMPSPIAWRSQDHSGCIARVGVLMLACVSLACASVAQLLYILHFYKPHFQSDDAVLNMLAESMWNQGSLFPQGWVTNNGDLMVPSGALLVAPLLSWVPNGFEAHAVAGVFALLTMLCAFFWFLAQKVRDPAILMIAVAVCASGLSWYCAHAIYQQTTYLWWTAGFFVCATLIWKWRRDRDAGKKSVWIGAALFGLVFAICFANPARTAIMFVLPLIAFDRGLGGDSRSAGMLMRMLSRLGLVGSSSVRVLAAAFVFAAVSYAMLMHAGRMETVHGASDLHWAGWSSVARHLGLFVTGWLPLLGASPSGIVRGSGLFESLLDLGRLVLALWLTWIAFAEVATVLRRRDRFRRGLVFAFVAAFVPTFLLYVFLAPLAVNVSTMRYFIVPLFILLALAAVRAAENPKGNGLAASLVLSGVGVIAALTSTQRFVFHGQQPLEEFWRIQPSATMLLADTLRRERLTWGYATWWNAGATTVLSDGSVRVNPVTLFLGGIRPFPMMVQKDWYVPQSHLGETFLALDASESTDATVRELQDSLGVPRRIVQAPNHMVLVYDYNIMRCASSRLMSDTLDASRAEVDVTVLDLRRAADGTVQSIVVALRNDTGIRLSGTGPYPISIGMRLLDSTGAVRNPDWVHYPLSCDLEPGESGRFVVPVPSIAEGRWTIQVDLVQEGVAWFHQWGRPMFSIDLAKESGAVRPGGKP